MRKIILLGYMGVGKTTIAKLLSEKTKIKSVDLDNLIENKIGLSIPEIFQKKGEIYFRKVEYEVFKDLMETDEELIIATGGGTPCYSGNHLFLKAEHSISIYLKASLYSILERLKSEGSDRPLVANKSAEELKEFVAKHLFERSYFYNQANYKVTVDTKSPEVIAQEIIGLLN